MQVPQLLCVQVLKMISSQKYEIVKRVVSLNIYICIVSLECGEEAAPVTCTIPAC